MSDKIVLRVFSVAGRSRVEIPAKETFGKLKEELEQRLHVPTRELKLYLDEKKTKEVKGRDTDTLAQLKLKNGDIIHVGNKETKFSADNVSGTQPKNNEESKGDVEMIDTSSKNLHGSPSLQKAKSKPKSDEEIKKAHCRHGPMGRCVNCLGVTKESMQEVKHKCLHPPGQKCGNCISDDVRQDQVKHQSFEHYLSEILQKCKGKHKADQKCQNCVPVFSYSYKVDYNCKNHKPFPEGMCNKCLPQAAVLKRQHYRHVDYVSFMNFQEMASFVGYWQQLGCMEQRMAWLYGYYSEDPNYPEGVRVNVEAVYEPPQLGEINGVEPLEDPNAAKVDLIAQSLSLEKVGLMFTSINNDTFLTSQEVRKIAQLQQEHLVDHPEGYKVSKFVTVVVKAKGDGAETGVEAYMVSDQCQALERDGVFGVQESRRKMVAKQPGPNEMVPAIVKEGKTAKDFEPDFFIVSVAHGQPKGTKDYNILKNYDFQTLNRGKAQTRQDFKDYIKRHKNEPAQRKFACFQLLVYLAEMMDIHTAVTIAAQVAEEKPLDPALVELLESI